MGIERAQIFSQIDNALAAAASSHKDRASGQVSLFDVFETAAPAPAARAASAVPPWSAAEKLAFEKELLGFYVTGHPLDDYRALLEGGKFVQIAKLGEQEDKSNVDVAGALISVEKKFSKKGGKPFAIVILEDFSAQIEIMVWGDTFTKAAPLLEVGNVVTISGRLDIREEAPRLSANEMKPLKRPEQREKPIVLALDRTKSTEKDLIAIRDIIWQSPGSRKVEFRVKGDDGRQLRLIPSDEFRVAWSPDTEERLGPWLP